MIRSRSEEMSTCRLFEPYIVQLMGKLLERFGDGSASVRHATDGVARAVMANLSSQGDTMHTLLPKTASTAALFYIVLSSDAEA